MPKKTINALNAGELSPYLFARSDIEKYDSGCLVMENYVPLPYGGATRRPAIKYIGESKQDDQIRLIPFKSSITNSAFLEFGDKYIRIWKNGELVEVDGDPVELGSPYDLDDLDNIKVAQSVDVMWLASGTRPIHRISNIGSSSWTIEQEDFDIPPLLDENSEDIEISTSGTSGQVTLKSTIDFFNVEHIGASFKFQAIRDTNNNSLSVNFTSTDFSEPIDCSNSNWEIGTSGTWLGKLVLQISTDGGDSWENYITIGNTISAGTGGEKNFTVSSDEPEKFNTKIRLHYIDSSGTCSCDLKIDNPYYETLVKITGYTDERNVVAEVINDFQDKILDYVDFGSLSGTVALGTKAYIPSSLEYSSNQWDVSLLSSSLSSSRGCDYGGGSFWVVTEDLNIIEISDDFSAVLNTFDVSAYYSTLWDICYYAGDLYLLGYQSNRYRVRKFSTSGVHDSQVAFFETSGWVNGIGYYNGHFYLSRGVSGNSYIYKYTTSWVYTNKFASRTGSVDKTGDIAGSDGFLFSTNDEDNTVDVYNEDLVQLSSADISLETSSPKGIAWDGANIFVLSSTGTFYQYDVQNQQRYYECVFSYTTAGSFDDERSNWSLRTPSMNKWSEGAFSDYRGYPKAIALFENRLCYGGTSSSPDTIWLSRIDDFSGFNIGSLDDDAMKLTMGSGQIDQIQWMVSQEKLVIGTTGAEWSLGASDERKAITPTGYNLKMKTTYGTSSIQGIIVNSAVLFPMRQSRKVREWDLESIGGDYVPPDLSILAEHITDGGIKQWDYQQQPDNILWCIRGDGTLVGFTYERDQNVVGWHRQTNGEFQFESVAIIPSEDMGDEIYFSIKINVGGSDKRYIASMNQREWGSDLASEWQGSDLWIDYQNAGDALHLAGKEVSLHVDGVPQGTQTVGATGDVVGATGTHNIVGLPFIPKLAPLYLVAENQYGSSKGGKIGASVAKIHFKDTYSAKTGQNEVSLEDVRFHPDKSPLYSDVATVYMDNANEYLQTCYITQEDGMPITVLAMIPEVEV